MLTVSQSVSRPSGLSSSLSLASDKKKEEEEEEGAGDVLISTPSNGPSASATPRRSAQSSSEEISSVLGSSTLVGKGWSRRLLCTSLPLSPPLLFSVLAHGVLVTRKRTRTPVRLGSALCPSISHVGNVRQKRVGGRMTPTQFPVLSFASLRSTMRPSMRHLEGGGGKRGPSRWVGRSDSPSLPISTSSTLFSHHWDSLPSCEMTDG